MMDIHPVTWTMHTTADLMPAAAMVTMKDTIREVARLVMTSVSEVYFLVRVGSWDEDDLENWAQERADALMDEVHERAYALGFTDGMVEGKDAMYKEAVDAVKCLR
jgi:hypothetical protein